MDPNPDQVTNQNSDRRDRLPAGRKPTGGNSGQIWDACDNYLKTVLTYNDYTELVAPLAVAFEKDRINLIPSQRVNRDRLEEAVVPLLTRYLADTPVTLAVKDDAGEVQVDSGPGVWAACLSLLETELPEQQFNTWIRPLQEIETPKDLRLLAPNQFVADWFNEHFHDRIQALVADIVEGEPPQITVEIGHSASHTRVIRSQPIFKAPSLNPTFTFDNFVEGKSNQLAKAAAQQVSAAPGESYNPLFIYGGVGLGKTHLMHAIGNAILERNPEARVMYCHSERFVANMVRALQTGSLSDFKSTYRDLDALLIDDIQFFAGKERSQEEFFHTFNALAENRHQIILTSDRFPKELNGLEERLKSRFGWGLTVAIDPPELETRVAILRNIAKRASIDLPDEVAFFIAKRVSSNVRELEGALRRVIASSHFSGQSIDLGFTREALRDLLAVQEKLITIENIQKTVAEYFKLRVSELMSKRRNRPIARARQIAMSLSRELTAHSMPEIGDVFGGRDNTTVLHACRTIDSLRASDPVIASDYENLLRTLSA